MSGEFVREGSTHAERMTVGPYPRPVHEIGSLVNLSYIQYKMPPLTDSDFQYDAYAGYPDIQKDFEFIETPKGSVDVKRSRLAC